MLVRMLRDQSRDEGIELHTVYSVCSCVGTDVFQGFTQPTRLSVIMSAAAWLKLHHQNYYLH